MQLYCQLRLDPVLRMIMITSPPLSLLLYHTLTLLLIIGCRVASFYYLAHTTMTILALSLHPDMKMPEVVKVGMD